MTKRSNKEEKRYYEAVLQNDAEKDPDISAGSLVVIGYKEEQFFMNVVNWGADEDYERSSRGIVEQDWLFDKENTRKLMECMGVRTGKGLIGKMNRRFKGRMLPNFAITDYCNKRSIKSQYFVNY